nr:retrovirus-related Pol polyprotein from transposon TNT 1-94 [Tanacetum cinerariifolium]
MGLWYSKDIDMSLTADLDVGHARCQDTRRSTLRSAQFLGDKLVSWSSKKQKSTTISKSCLPSPLNKPCLILSSFPRRIDLISIKCNGRNPHGLTPREPTFQVILDAIALTSCYLAFLITADVPKEISFRFAQEYMVETLMPFLMKKTMSFLRELSHTGEINLLNDVVVDQMHQPWRTFAALINRGLSGKTSGKTLSWRNKIGMHTSKDDYLINTLRFVSAKESTQIYGKLLPKTLTSPEMKESKAYKTYLGYASGAIPPKIARKFKKTSPSKKDSIVIREDPVETQSKRKEKVDVAHGKGIDLLSEVALTKEAQMKEVRKKILRDFHKTHPSGSGTVAENPPRVDKITPTVKTMMTMTQKNEGNDEDNKSEDDKTPSDSEKGSDFEQDTDGSKSDFESNQQEYEEEVKYNDEKDDDDDDDDKSDGDEAKGMDGTTNKFSDDVQDKEADVKMTDETKVPDASFSHSSDLASKFLSFLDIHPNDAKIVSPLDVHVHHEVPRIHTSTLLIVMLLVILEASPVCITIPQSSQTLTSPLPDNTHTTTNN